MLKSESCDPKYVLQSIESIKKGKDKLDYISDVLSRCTIPDTTTTPTRKKRKMNASNLLNII